MLTPYKQLVIVGHTVGQWTFHQGFMELFADH